MNVSRWPIALVGGFVVAMFLPAAAAAQVVPTSGPGTELAACRTDGVEERLAASHPLGSAAGAPVCVGAAAWVPTAPLGSEREAWRRALRFLADAGAACRLAGAALARLEAAGRVSVWQAADTAGGVIYYGATYLGPDSEPIAIQFWARAFERPVAWLAGAIAHEAFHALTPRGTEDEALRFGERCARRETVRTAPVALTLGMARIDRGWR